MKKMLFITLFLCSSSSLFSAEEKKISSVFCEEGKITPPRRPSISFVEVQKGTPMEYYQKILPLLAQKQDPNPQSPGANQRAILNLSFCLLHKTPLDEESRLTLRKLEFIDKKGQPSSNIKNICGIPDDFVLPSQK